MLLLLVLVVAMIAVPVIAVIAILYNSSFALFLPPLGSFGELVYAFFATLKEEDFEVVVVRSLNKITDDIHELEEFVKVIADMGIWFSDKGTVQCRNRKRHERY